MTVEQVTCLRRAFAMLALAMLMHRSRDFTSQVVLEMPENFRTERMPDDAAKRLLAEIKAGNVTTIAADIKPLTFIIYKGSFGSLRAVYGVWLERPASWRGKPRAADYSDLTEFGNLLVEKQKQLDSTLKGNDS